MFFSRLSLLMQEGMEGHIEELLKFNASEQEINYRMLRQKLSKSTYFQNVLGRGPPPPPGAVRNVLDTLRKN